MNYLIFEFDERRPLVDARRSRPQEAESRSGVWRTKRQNPLAGRDVGIGDHMPHLHDGP